MLVGGRGAESRDLTPAMSPQFHERMATIAEQFEQMQADVVREKAAMRIAPGQSAKNKSK
jgi:hypothetical protein